MKKGSRWSPRRRQDGGKRDAAHQLRKNGFNEELMRWGILIDEVRALSAAPRTLSGLKKWREKRTISVTAHKRASSTAHEHCPHHENVEKSGQ